MAEPLLAARDLHGGYGGDQDVLRGASIEVYPGQMVAVIGPNGAGKSTLLNALFGLIPVRNGTIHLAGQRVDELAPVARLRHGLALCPQGRCNFPAMTVQENLEMGGSVLPARALPGAIDRVWARFPFLRERRRQRAGTMSGGEQQQLELAMSLMVKPRVLLIDEPSLGLDPRNVGVLFSVVASLREESTAVIMVEQNAVKALEVSDTACVLEQGRTVRSGTAQQILHDPGVRDLYLGGVNTAWAEEQGTEDSREHEHCSS